jgi:ABC-2 type transport system permease protein
MVKLWLVLRYEYRNQVFRRRFIFALLSVPALIVLSVGLGYLTVVLERDDTPLGYVDQSGLLSEPLAPPLDESEEPVPILPFRSEQEARIALDDGRIQAYYILPPDYVVTGKIELVYVEFPSENATDQFYDFLQINLLADRSDAVARRAAAGSDVIYRLPGDTPGGGREFGPQPVLSDFLSLLVGFSFVILLMISGGQLMQALLEEKENRTMEMMMTSLSPTQLISGKVLGIAAVGFTQLLAWFSVGVLGVLIGGRYLELDFFQDLSFDVSSLIILGIVLVLAYVLISAFVVAVGATVAEAQEGQQVIGLFVLPLMLPIWLMMQIVEQPHGPLAVALSLIPPTAPLTYAIRIMFVRVPTWQVLASIGLLLLSTVAALWLAGRAFRLGMLRYGQRLRLTELLGRTVSQRDSGGTHA